MGLGERRVVVGVVDRVTGGLRPGVPWDVRLRSVRDLAPSRPGLQVAVGRGELDAEPITLGAHDVLQVRPLVCDDGAEKAFRLSSSGQTRLSPDSMSQGPVPRRVSPESPKR